MSRHHFANRLDGHTNPTNSQQVGWFPPLPADNAVDFSPPSFTKLKQRRATHLVDPDYIHKFEMAIKLLNDLPGDDPRSIYQPANALFAYAVDNDETSGRWLFFPWYRIYLYHYERVLGKLLGDEGFSIPFWNWDHPEGMQRPPAYPNTGSPHYDPDGNPSHRHPTTHIIDYDGTDPQDADQESKIQDMLASIYRTMITNGKTAELFMGHRLVTGARPNPGAGSLDLFPHTNIHVWSGNTANPYGEDMGNFYSSGRDIMFYGLHANVDRMWDIWTNTLGHQNFDDDEWLNAAFYFYDEKKQLIKVKVSDALDSEKLGYTYETRELPWLDAKPVRKSFHTADHIAQLAAKTAAEFPLTLSSTVSTVVKRPGKSRSDEGNEAAEEEVLVIRDIAPEPSAFSTFDVYVNAPDTAGLTPSAAEFAGSFSNVPHKKEGFKPINTDLRLALTDLLKEIGAEDDDSVVVTLVPRKGGGKVKIGGVGISYIKIR